MLHLKSVFPNLPKGAALDVGTRTGEFIPTLLELMPEGSTVVGLDCDAAILEKASARFPQPEVTLQTGDAARMKFRSGTFQLVALSNTLHHLEYSDRVLKEMLRVLRPGGWLLINEMFSDCPDPAQQTHHLQHSVEARLDMISGGYQRPPWTKGELLDILGQLPLEQVQVAELLEEPEMDRKLAEKTAKLHEAVERHASHHPEYQSLLRQADEVQRRYEQVGIRRCTQLVYGGRKAREAREALL